MLVDVLATRSTSLYSAVLVGIFHACALLAANTHRKELPTFQGYCDFVRPSLFFSRIVICLQQGQTQNVHLGLPGSLASFCVSTIHDAAGRPSVAKAWRDMFETQNVQAFLYPGSALTVQ